MSVVRTHSAAVFACRDAACRPPTSGGSGGSLPARGAKSAAAAAALVENAPGHSAINYGDVKKVHYRPEAGTLTLMLTKGQLAISRDQVKGIHPVDLAHVLLGGYTDGKQLHFDEDTVFEVVKFLTGKQLAYDQKAMDNYESIGAPTPNGTPNFIRIVNSKGKG